MLWLWCFLSLSRWLRLKTFLRAEIVAEYKQKAGKAKRHLQLEIVKEKVVLRLLALVDKPLKTIFLSFAVAVMQTVVIKWPQAHFEY